MTADFPLAEEIAYGDPLDLLGGAGESPFTLLLDSAAAPGDPRARFSYLCLDPVETFLLSPDDLAHAIRGEAEGGADPLAWAQARLREWPAVSREDLPPFQGGIAGLLGYELGGAFERLPPPSRHGAAHPVVALGLYDVAVAFDHAQARAWIVSTGYPEKPVEERARRARRRLAEVRARLASAAPPLGEPAVLEWTSDVPRADYLRKVQTAIDYIHAGDVFQINLTRELAAKRPPGLSAAALYRDMRQRTCAPFSAYMSLPGDTAVCSFSPERFLEVGPNRAVETRPIKGTRPRGAAPAEDAALARELLASEKDRAENLMIVDLLRNDLARVSEIGSVKVPQLCGLESFGAVHHLVSVVTARLREGTDAVDLLRVAFPGGSITGAPKIRAMEIIHELERRRRGPYCGSLCWLGFDGQMDSSILIRTIAVEPDRLRYGVGGGIVAESGPESEWQETVDKAAAFMAPANRPDPTSGTAQSGQAKQSGEPKEKQRALRS